MSRAATGDLTDVLEFDGRSDELGDLSRSINGTYAYLQEMSGVAKSLAQGDLRVKVAPRSDRDSFGLAFVDMVDRLSQVIGEVRAGAAALSGSSASCVEGSSFPGSSDRASDSSFSGASTVTVFVSVKKGDAGSPAGATRAPSCSVSAALPFAISTKRI